MGGVGNIGPKAMILASLLKNHFVFHLFNSILTPSRCMLCNSLEFVVFSQTNMTVARPIFRRAILVRTLESFRAKGSYWSGAKETRIPQTKGEIKTTCFMEMSICSMKQCSFTSVTQDLISKFVVCTSRSYSYRTENELYSFLLFK